MKTWLDFESKKWVSEQPKKYWTGLICEKTGEKIFTGDTVAFEYFDKRKIIDTLSMDYYCGHNEIQRIYKPILISHNENQ